MEDSTARTYALRSDGDALLSQAYCLYCFIKGLMALTTYCGHIIRVLFGFLVARHLHLDGRRVNRASPRTW